MRKLVAILVIALLIGWLGYQALIYYDNNFRYGRMRETPAVKPHEQPLLIMEAGTVPFSGGEIIFKIAKPEDLTSPLEPDDPATIKQGEEVYYNYCAMCHGTNHDGNATVGQSFAPLPTDLRSEKVQSLSEGGMFKEISYGIPDGRQPPLATTIDVTDRWRVVAYVKSLGIRQ
jgi:mono/diheme cytochrome c family protein